MVPYSKHNVSSSESQTLEIFDNALYKSTFDLIWFPFTKTTCPKFTQCDTHRKFSKWHFYACCQYQHTAHHENLSCFCCNLLECHKIMKVCFMYCLVFLVSSCSGMFTVRIRLRCAFSRGSELRFSVKRSLKLGQGLGLKIWLGPRRLHWCFRPAVAVSPVTVCSRSSCLHIAHSLTTVMLNYAGEYCDACQATVTVMRSSDTALKSCLEWLTMSYIISDSAYLIFCAVLQTDRHG